MYWLAVTGPVVIQLRKASTEPLWATSGLPVLAHYWTDEWRHTGPEKAASLDIQFDHLWLPTGPDGKCLLGHEVALTLSQIQTF